MELIEGAVIADRFRLVRQLGRGGMGEVWAAQHISLDIPCAVKFIHAESAKRAEVRARFEREARASAQLRSVNVVQILDYGVFQDTPYIAMEYLEGEPLSARLQRRTRLDPFETYAIIAGIGKGLNKAHQAGIVHRDLKPENVFLVPDDGAEIAKVLDFGVAKQTRALDSNTETGALLGTPYYMSPEQAQGTKAIDHRADLWSLAVVTFRCLTGELPFKSQALGDLLIKIVTHPIPVPSHVQSGLPDGFDAWWGRASDRDPDRRFQSAKEMVEALGLALGVSMPANLQSAASFSGASNPGLPMSTMIADPGSTGPHGALPFTAGGPPPGVGSPHGSHGAVPHGAAPHASAPYGAGHPMGGSVGAAGMPRATMASSPEAYLGGAHPGAATPFDSNPAMPQIHPSGQPHPSGDGYPSGEGLHAASVGGVATHSPVASKSNSKLVALVGVVSATIVVGGIGVFLLTRPAADPGAERDAAGQVADEGAPEPPTEPSGEASSEASADASTEPTAEPSADATAEPTAKPTATAATTAPKAVPYPVGGRPPKPVPRPSPKGDDYDPGF